ncbi:hypothetical protein QBC38DRAFT_462203 [Podospora fimiseda]|uniref:NAD-dependent epimerase/dehydratase domain-containing protein n=1 Tax=Podospora fimiseda TaxID=252190 RepID=A0AAN6YK72_9PEZI|nr:hypothetical protein QBC38DRAFT_462203 [Podospora fimiseda]
MSSSSQPLNVLVIGANGYLGKSLSTTFLRASLPSAHNFFRVYGLIRRPSTAPSLAQSEIIPIIIPSLSSSADPTSIITSHAKSWHVIITCTEPSRSSVEFQHWDDLLSLIESLSQISVSEGGGIKPFVIASSGCKDYGTTLLHGDLALTPHTEDSPLQTHEIIQARMNAALRVLEVAATTKKFDAAVVRATSVYGYTSSYYGAAFDYASAFIQAGKRTLDFTTPKETIMHGVHVDDCAEGYLSLATTYLFGEKEKATEEVFNISSRRYETLEEIGNALAKEYGFAEGARFGVEEKDIVAEKNCELVFGWSQWVSSEKIRSVTGWKDHRPLFSENIGVYRRAFEAAKGNGDDDVEKARRRMEGNWGEGYLETS